jgi:hypothetical protein
MCVIRFHKPKVFHATGMWMNAVFGLADAGTLFDRMSPANPMVDGYFRDEIGYFASFSA